MKKIAICILVLLAPAALALSDGVSFGAHLGGIFLNYQRTDSYLGIGLDVLKDIGETLAFDFGVEFGIKRDLDLTGEIQPRVLIPVNVGINFNFPIYGPPAEGSAERREIVSFHLGLGVTPVFRFGPTVPLNFFMGPFLKVEGRLHVHPAMRVIIYAQQDLLIGGENWINTATRLGGGINFGIPRS